MELIDKAKVILNNDNLTDTEIANKIGTSRMMIHNYRSGSSDLNKAKYEVIRALADEYDKADVTMMNMANTGAFKYFVARMESFFTEIKEDQKDSYDSDEGYADDLALIPVLDRIGKEVVNNTPLMVELYDIYYKNLDKKNWWLILTTNIVGIFLHLVYFNKKIASQLRLAIIICIPTLFFSWHTRDTLFS